MDSVMHLSRQKQTFTHIQYALNTYSFYRRASDFDISRRELGDVSYVFTYVTNNLIGLVLFAPPFC